MENFPASIAEKIENQLAQVILYVGAIDSLLEAYQSQPRLRHDAFLFRTVYESLWDAVIVRIGTIWDTRNGVASLPKLSKHLRKIDSQEAKALAAEMDRPASAEWTRLKEWRHTVVAHAKIPLDTLSFDRDFEINIADVRKEAERVETLLEKANKCLGRPQIYYEVLKEDSVSNARNSLSRWIAGAA